MERAMSELIAHCKDQIDFTVLSMSLADDLKPLVRWRRVPGPMRPFPLKLIAFFVVAGAMIRRERPDLIHTCGAIIPSRADIASIHFCHRGFVEKTGSLAPAGAPPLRRMNSMVTRLLAIAGERLCYRPERLRRLACVSSGVEEEVRTAYPGIRTVITPNGVDLERFRPNPAIRESVRNDEDAEDDVVVLFVGGDWDRKGLDLAIAALGRARIRTRTSLRVWVVGPGDVSRYAAIAEAHGLEGRVQFFGSRTDTERFYAAADILVFPTLYEAFPLVAMEASASGLAVLGTRVNGLTELESIGGAMLVHRSPEGLADGLVLLADDPPARRALGTAAERWVRQFPWSRSADSVLDLYRELVADSGLAGDRE